MDLTPLSLSSNITDVALVFEGGGMRASYTSAVVQTLLENELYFDWVAGISAGSSNVANYLVRDPARAKRSFVDFAADQSMGSIRTFLRGQGLFNSEYIYQQTSGPGQALPFAWDNFAANPAQFRIGAFNCVTGETAWWGRDDVKTRQDLMTAIQASSSMPVVMPPTFVNGEPYLDGAIGENGGIALDIAIRDGYEKFFFVLTQKRDYVKKSPSHDGVIRRALKDYPLAVEATLDRPRKYNETRERILELEREGKAYVFWANDMSVGNQERRVDRLQRNFSLGRRQALAELPKWREFLGK